jgi:hypothetical protein
MKLITVGGKDLFESKSAVREMFSIECATNERRKSDRKRRANDDDS